MWCLRSAYEYRAFGEQLKRLDSSGSETGDGAKYSYGGKELDSGSDLYYINARYYDVTIGRFINADPIQDGSNWYVYVRNNPLGFVDPTGLTDTDLEENGEVNPNPYELRNKEIIEELHPNLRKTVVQFLDETKKQSMDILITSVYRSIEEQDRLYQIGRNDDGTLIDGEAIVTYAKGGESYHNYRLVFDVVEVKNGEALWDNENWEKIGQIRKELGLEWGGDWFKIADKPHFQKTFGNTIDELKERYNEDKNDDGFVDLNNGEWSEKKLLNTNSEFISHNKF